MRFNIYYMTDKKQVLRRDISKEDAREYLKSLTFAEKAHTVLEEIKEENEEETMDNKEKVNTCLVRRKEIETEVKEIETEVKERQKKINKLKQEYEVLGDLASRILNEEEEQKIKKEKGEKDEMYW